MSVCAAEDPAVTITLSRPAGDLIVGDDCPPSGSGLWWNVLALPDWSMRYTYAPPSAYVPGQVLLAAVSDAAAVPVTFAAIGTDLADLQVQKATLEAVLAQFEFTLTITADGVVLGSWQADCSLVSWGPVTPQLAGLMVAEGTVSIPVNPAGAP